MAHHSKQLVVYESELAFNLFKRSFSSLFDGGLSGYPPPDGTPIGDNRSGVLSVEPPDVSPVGGACKGVVGRNLRTNLWNRTTEMRRTTINAPTAIKISAQSRTIVKTVN